MTQEKFSIPMQVDSLVVRKRRVLMSVTQTKEKLKNNENKSKQINSFNNINKKKAIK